jgi:hypothetical protein
MFPRASQPACKLARPKEQPIWGPRRYARMMYRMRANDALKVWHAQEQAHAQTSVNQSVVHHKVRKAEQAHSEPHAERQFARDRGARGGPPQQQRNGQRRVQKAEHVVGLEAAAARRMMRSMHPPQPRVPNAPMQDRGPKVHEQRGSRGDGQPHERVAQRTINHGAHHD